MKIINDLKYNYNELRYSLCQQLVVSIVSGWNVVGGAAYEALKEARKIIKNNYSVLAISLYHKPEDVFEIPKLILDIYSGYKLYLRHYSFSRHETVLYAI